MDVYIQELGSKLRKEQNHFVVISGGKNNPISIDLIDSIIIEGSCSLTTDSIKLAVDNDIPIYISDYYGNILGKFWKSKFDRTANIRQRQLQLFPYEYGKKLSKIWIEEKIESQKNHLKKIFSRKNLEFDAIQKEFDEIIRNIREINLNDLNFSNVVMGYEGTASKKYYSHIKVFVDKKWEFNGRVNFRATDPYNMTLNYLFGVLYSKVEHALVVAGLDPKIGVLHTTNTNKEALTYDYIEKYRFIAWETVFSLFSKKLINKNYFDDVSNILTRDGKKVILEEFYEKMKRKVERNGKEYTYESTIMIGAKEIAKELIEDEISDSI